MKKLALLLLAIAFLSGCATMVQDPVVTVKDLSIVSLDTGGAGMELYLNVDNPNNFDITLQGYSYNLKVMALPFAKGGGREEMNFPGETATDVRIPIRIAYADLLEVLKRIPDPDDIPYQLSAGLDLKTPVGQTTIPVHRSGSYALPKKYRPAYLLNRLSTLFRGE